MQFEEQRERIKNEQSQRNAGYLKDNSVHVMGVPEGKERKICNECLKTSKN